MTDRGSPKERLDALLAGLEDEVLRSSRTGQDLAEEGGCAEDAAAMRSGIEAVIQTRMNDGRRGSEPVHAAAGTSGRSKVAQAMQRLRRWTGEVQGRGLHAAPQVRMAFSGKSKVGKTARKPTRRGRGGSAGAGQKDC